MESKYQIVIDTKEKQPHIFSESNYCSGFVLSGLKTGDYSIVGHEDKLSIERKRNLAEWSQNINQDRFDRELVRLNEYGLPFLLLEFSVEDMLNFPEGSGIPKKLWPKLRVSSPYIVKRTLEIYRKYPNIQVIFGGGRDNAHTILNQIFMRYWRDK